MRNFINSYNKFVFGLEQINEAAANFPEEFVESMEKCLEMRFRVLQTIF